MKSLFETSLYTQTYNVHHQGYNGMGTDHHIKVQNNMNVFVENKCVSSSVRLHGNLTGIAGLDRKQRKRPQGARDENRHEGNGDPNRTTS